VHKLEIDNAHDYYTVKLASGRVTVELWSRGTFTVDLVLSRDDAKAFGRALIEEAESDG